MDLRRSALLRTGSRREVERLEIALRYHFGDPAAEAAARAQGRTLTSADFRAMGSSRRHPGRCDDGYTEFYTNRCFEAMFDLAQRSAGLGEGRAAPRLIRGIDPAYCVWHGEGDPNSAPATRDHGPGSRAGLRARREQESNELEAKNSAKISQVLAVAQEYAEHLLWVDLRAWRERRDLNLPDLHSREGLVSLFFDGFRAAATGGDASAEPRSSWQIAFEARLAPILAPAVSSDPRGLAAHAGRSGWGVARTPRTLPCRSPASARRGHADAADHGLPRRFRSLFVRAVRGAGPARRKPSRP